MNLRLLSMAVASFISLANVNAALEWPTVDTRNNKIELDAEICKFNPQSQEIICKSTEGKEIIIDDVEIITGASTGTPPWLQFSNYIGQTLNMDAEGLPGAGKRTIYLKK